MRGEYIEKGLGRIRERESRGLGLRGSYGVLWDEGHIMIPIYEENECEDRTGIATIGSIGPRFESTCEPRYHTISWEPL